MTDPREETHFDPEFSRQVRQEVDRVHADERRRLSARRRLISCGAALVVVAALSAVWVRSHRAQRKAPPASSLTDLQRHLRAESYPAAQTCLAAMESSDPVTARWWRPFADFLELESAARKEGNREQATEALRYIREADGADRYRWLVEEVERRAGAFPPVRGSIQEDLSPPKLEPEPPPEPPPILEPAPAPEALLLYDAGKGEQALKMLPDGSEVSRRVREVCAQYKAAIEAMDRGRLALSARSFRRVLEIEPNAANWYRLRAEEGAGQIRSASSEQAKGWVEEARRLKGQEKYADAFRLAADALAVDPDQAEAQALVLELRSDANRLFEEGYVLREIDPEKTRQRWSVLVEILPEDDPLRRKAAEGLATLR